MILIDELQRSVKTPDSRVATQPDIGSIAAAHQLTLWARFRHWVPVAVTVANPSRAMRHKLAMPQYLPELHNPYALDDLSLCDVLSPSSNRRISLREFCAVLGLRYGGLEDDDVEKYYRQKRVHEIAELCESEVMNILRIWLRRELFQGRLSNYGFQRSEETLEGFNRTVSA